MAIRDTGIYTETEDPRYQQTRGGFSAGIDTGTIADQIRRLTADLGTMISLKIDLLKTEIRDAVVGYTKDGLMLAVAAFLGIWAAIFLNLTLMFLLARIFPFSQPINYALGALCLTVLYGIGAGILVVAAKNRMAKRSVVPERSVEEMKRDKQWLTEIA